MGADWYARLAADPHKHTDPSQPGRTLRPNGSLRATAGHRGPPGKNIAPSPSQSAIPSARGGAPQKIQSELLDLPNCPPPSYRRTNSTHVSPPCPNVVAPKGSPPGYQLRP